MMELTRRWGGQWGRALACLVLGIAALIPMVVSAAQPPTGQPQATDVVPEPVETYSYDPEGRRDPFVSLLTRGIGVRPPTERPPGLAGLSINDISLRGLVESAGEYLAVMLAPDDRTYILRGDEQLFDAVVKSVTAEGVVFLQAVNDPLSLVNEREVFRTLQGQEEVR